MLKILLLLSQTSVSSGRPQSADGLRASLWNQMLICSGPSDPGVARQLTLRASCALISTTAMIVLSWSKATRDLLKSFGWGIRALHQLDAATMVPSPRRLPPYHLAAGGRGIRTLGPASEN